MSPIEIQEITDRVNAMTEDEQVLVASLLPVQILLGAVETKYNAVADELDEMNELIKIKNNQIARAASTTRTLTHVLNEISTD